MGSTHVMRKEEPCKVCNETGKVCTMCGLPRENGLCDDDCADEEPCEYCLGRGSVFVVK
jgi:RecJ-like exonuclease